MKKYLLFFALAVIIAAFLCSCTNTREIDEQSIVSAVGFKWEKELTVTVEILTVSIDEQNIGTRIFKASGDTPEKAFAALDKKLPKRLLFDHCAAIILSAGMDKEKQKELLFYCIDEPTVNLGTPVVFSQDIDSLLSAEHESAAVGYDIMQILRHNKLEKQSRLYKAALSTEKSVFFKNENGKAVKV